jgi:pimeloyl-ACP methyl ester carboxylesterase
VIEGTVTSIEVDVEVNVSAALPFGDESNVVSASIFLPVAAGTTDEMTVLFCWPGGSYDRGYWSFEFEGNESYSAAEFWTARGFAVVAADPLGSGRSSKPSDGDAVDMVIMARAADRFVREICARFVAGSIHESLAGVPRVVAVGLGHSLGGKLVITQQALHGSYDLVGSLGNAYGQNVAVDGQMGRDGDDEFDIARRQAMLFFKDTWGDVYGTVDKTDHAGWLYGPNDAADVVAADMARTAPWTRRVYIDALIPGHNVQHARAIAAPLFLSFGEVDIPDDARNEVSHYTSCDDITLLVVPDAGHCSNFSPNREVLWRRFAAWVDSYS